MSSPVNIQYLERHQVDTRLWDACIQQAPNGRIYAYTVYLDHMADHWAGLVMNDYEAVMPLPYRKKYGISYLYQPFLVAQGGVFGKNITGAMVRSFLDHIPSKYRLWEFPLNQDNLFADTGYPLYPRINYVLPLDKPYEALYEGYRENVRRNIKKAARYGCKTSSDVQIHDVVRIAVAQNGKDEGFARFEKLYSALSAGQEARCFGIVSQNNELLSSCAILYAHNRMYYILVGNHPNGRTLGASHALIDAIIREHADSGLLLDFEGSDIRNLAFFYSSFGAHEEQYAAIRLNRLPWYIRMFKRS